MASAADPSAARRLRVGVDIGGTFTDVVVLDDDSGELRTGKTWSTPDDPARLLAVFDDVGVDCADVALFSHAGTVGVNAVVTRTGVPAGLLCSRGHRDVLDMGRALRRPEQVWDFASPRPHQVRPIIPRSWRREITERTLHDGSILVPLDEAEVLHEAARLVAKGAESIAIAYINSYVNPEHERRTRELIESAFPRIPVFTSTDIFPVFREIFRTTSVAINAYVSPKIDGYVGQLDNGLRRMGFDGVFTIMKVDGGFATADALRGRGIETMHSGPVAGVAAAMYLGAEMDSRRLLILDMGGTTTDVSVIDERGAGLVTDFEVEQDLFLGIPVVDVKSIGTGGGSIAWTDEAGGLRVGPASAGSDPGPACYGRGGGEATVTDAHLVRGTLSADHFLGGAERPDVARARAALERVAGPLGTTVEEAAQGIIDIADVKMTGALRSISIYRGKDPADYALLAVGAAGPMHGPALGRELGVRETIVPPWPGEFSAFGLLAADYRAEAARSVMRRLTDVDPGALSDLLAELEHAALKELEEQGVDPATTTVTRWMDGSYVGQSWDTACIIPRRNAYGEQDIDDIRTAFEDAYENEWGTRLGMPVRMSAIRVTAIGSSRKPALRELPTGGERPSEEARAGDVAATLRDGGALRRATLPVFRRSALLAGNIVEGPAVIVQETSTTVLYRGDRARVDGVGNLRITHGEAA